MYNNNNLEKNYLSLQKDMNLSKEKKFSEYIKLLRKKNKYGERKTVDISTKELADLLDIGYATFRKILGGIKLNQTRDCIISICAGLGLTIEETNNALLLYEFSPLLTDNIRDQVIISAICESLRDDRKSTYKDLVQKLSVLNLGLLKIRNKSISTVSDNDQYIITSIEVEDGLVDLYNNRFAYSNFLSMEYSPSNLNIYSRMNVKDVNSKINYELIVGYRGKFDCYLEYEDLSIGFLKTEERNELITITFKEYFNQLKLITKKTYFESLSILNDTRNYSTRTSARFINGEFMVFAETSFTYLPGKVYYCFCKFIKGNMETTLSKQSRFMSYYLQNERCDSEVSRFIYSGKSDKNNVELNIKDLPSDDKFKSLKYLATKASEDLKGRIFRLLKAIRKKEVFVNNFKEVIDEYDQEYYIMKHYNMLDAYKAKEIKVIDDEFVQEDTYIPTVDNVLVDNGCGSINLSIKDLSRAYELGIEDINDVYSVIIEYGSIENILYIENS